MRPYAVALAAFAFAAPAAAQHPINGTWKSAPSDVTLATRPDVFQVVDGVYSCSSCQPSAYKVPADGKFHRVEGRPYWSDVAVDASQPDRLAFRFRRGEQVIGENVATLSTDGDTLTRVNRSSDNPQGVPVERTAVFTRIAPAAAGAHRASGGWRAAKLAQTTDAALTTTYQVDGRTVRSTTPLGDDYEARIGGPAVPIKGDPSGLMVRVTQPGPRMLEETYIRKGETQGVTRLTVSADGRTATFRTTNARTGAVTTGTATKQ